VHPLLERALPEERGSHVADAHHLVERGAEHALDVIPHGGYAAPWLAPGDDVEWPRSPGLGVGLGQPVGEMLGEGRCPQQGVEDAGAQ
jgi:hypothetical protein